MSECHHQTQLPIHGPHQKRANSHIHKKSGQIGSTLPSIITIKKGPFFYSHENNMDLRNHTN